MSKISDDLFFLFLVISQNFTKIFPVISANYLPKILTTFFLVISPNFYFFFLIFSFWTSFRMPPLSWIPGAVLHFLRIYLYFFNICLCIFSENSVVGCPPGWMPGAVAPPAPSSARHWCSVIRPFQILNSTSDICVIASANQIRIKSSGIANGLLYIISLSRGHCIGPYLCCIIQSRGGWS